MAHAPERKELARRLRRDEQLPLDELARRLGVARSTVYHWVRDLPVPGSGPGGGFSAASRARGTASMREARRRAREGAYTAGVEHFAIFRDTQSFREFLALYLAAGRLGDSRTVAIAHHDPTVIVLAGEWLELAARNRVRYGTTGASADGAGRPCLTVTDTLLRAELQAWLDCARAEWMGVN